MNSFTQAYRLVTFCPPEQAEMLAERIGAAIPSLDGDYDNVAWMAPPGTEQFRPLPGADPAKGEIGRITRAPSVRLEFSLPKNDELLNEIIEKALLPHHPWEKPVILVFDHWIYKKS